MPRFATVAIVWAILCLIFLSERAISGQSFASSKRSFSRTPRETLDSFASSVGLVNDAVGLYQLISGATESKASEKQPHHSVFQDIVENSTTAVIHQLTQLRYFKDEEAINDCHRTYRRYLMNATSTQNFLDRGKTVHWHVLHLLNGMLGLYEYGGDILRSTCDYVQCHPRKLRDAVGALINPINRGLFLHAAYIRLTNNSSASYKDERRELKDLYEKVLKRVAAAVKDCEALNKERIELQMEQLLRRNPEVPVSRTADLIYEMLRDRYENRNWVVLVYDSNAYVDGRNTSSYHATGSTHNAVAYALNNQTYTSQLHDNIEMFCNQKRFYWSALFVLRKCGYPSLPPAMFLWTEENVSTIATGLATLLPSGTNFHVFGRKRLQGRRGTVAQLFVKASSNVKYYQRSYNYESIFTGIFAQSEDGHTIFAL